MKAKLRSVARRFWAVPLLFAIGATLLALGVTAIDESLDTSLRLPFLFSGGPEGARALLAAIITSMISFTGLVFSITVVVLQLTSSQFSPRVLRSFLEDRFNQVALGVFVATFVYGLVVLRSVRGTAQVDPFVPQFAVALAFVLVLVSVLVFLSYINHIAQSIRAATILSNISDETRALIDDRFPADSQPEPWLSAGDGPSRVISAEDPGVVEWIDDTALARAAERAEVSIEMLRAVGEFVATGAPLARVHGRAQFDDGRLHATVRVGRERTMDQDVGFGLRQLVDIAERALSPGVNDPTTAVQALDHLHDIVRRLATRALPPRQRVTDEGRLLLSVPQPDFADYLALAFDEIAHWGRDSPRIERRIEIALRDLEVAARPEHRGAVTDAIARHRCAAPSSTLDALSPSDSGLR
ncbi:DUF2254 domain-containing protein [Knoellia sp. Soil729]|uniref:DUF2254 domain-containing protein n=1 Tax=Knoellia sp. Soil729 TaxID=1736394 RepID=UPI000ABC86D9|nr:DUF2254 domain-containing protein [Knoellia sp. Soil729]